MALTKGVGDKDLKPGPELPDKGPDFPLKEDEKERERRQAKEAEPKEAPTVLLELALYTNYRMNDEDYTKGTPYRFRTLEAMQLLSVTDFNRPVWKLYQSPPQMRKKTDAERVRDATEVRLPESGEPRHGLGEPNKKRIDVGTDDEIADILNRPDDAGNVTV